MLHVNPIRGNDATADGSDRAPFKTITRALEAASPNTVIQLAPGTYSTSTGETFPIALKPRITLQGNPETRGQQVVIRGGGAFFSPSSAQQNITILGGANQASLVGVTITNPNPNGYGLQIESSSPTIANNTFTNNNRGGIVVVGSSTSTIRNNFFYQNGETGIRVQGSAQPTVQENIVEQNGVGVFVDSTAAPRLLDNRMTQNKTGVVVQGEAKPYLRGNSVEGNEEFGLLAIALAQPDLGSSSDANANFFRNNRKQDVALQNTSRANATPPVKPQQTNQPSPLKTPSPAAEIQESGEIASPPIPTQPGVVVVPTILTPAVQPVPSVTFGDRIQANPPRLGSPPPANQPPLLPPPEPKSSPQSAKPVTQAILQTHGADSGITSTAFPKPSALSNTAQTSDTPRPMQVIRLTSPPVDDGTLPAETTLTTITIAPRARASTPPPIPMAQPASSVTGQPPVTTTRRIPIPVPVKPAIAEEIPAPPAVAPRPAATVQSSGTIRMPVQRQQVTSEFPTPLQPTPTTPATLVLPPRLNQPVSAPLPSSPTVPSSRSIVIPVPPPETDRPRQIPVKPAASPLSPLPLANNPTAKPGNLLPVPGPNIPVGNIGDMPSVYSTRGNQQPIPGVPITPGNAGFVVVKYRVVVVATDDTQQEQVRLIVPDAFPVVYRGQRVMQAGAFGDRTKADQLVASLSTQGLQAIIEPMD